MRSRFLAYIGAIVIAGSCAGPGQSNLPAASSTATPTSEPTVSSSTVAPIASPTATTARTVGFPQVDLIAATSGGELRVFRAGKWTVEAKICSDAVQAIDVAANRRTVIILCASQVSGASNPDARDAFRYDLVTKEKRAILGASTIGLGPISPDGRQVVMGAFGDCPMPAPVCQTKRTLLDLVTGSKVDILPSDYWLHMEMRWTARGLSYFLPECAEAGCPGPQKAGTYLWSGSTWTKLSSDRLVATNGRDHDVLERRRSLSDTEPLVVPVERVGATERVLSSSGGQEVALALADDGRIVTWRPDAAGGFDGVVVTYRDGREVRRSRAHFSYYVFGAAGSWIVTGELSGAPSWKIYAYSVDQDAVATLVPDFPLARLAVLPSQ